MWKTGWILWMIWRSFTSRLPHRCALIYRDCCLYAFCLSDLHRACMPVMFLNMHPSISTELSFNLRIDCSGQDLLNSEETFSLDIPRQL